MNEILRKALMRHHNEFFAMSKEEQDIFKLQEHNELDKKIEQFVNDAIGYKDHKRHSTDDALQFEYNKIMLPYSGIGDDYFMLNEFDWNEKILVHKNLYEYNEYYHNWQEEACEEDENYKDFKPTKLYNRFSAWARSLIDGDFYYLNLTSLEMWIYWGLEEVAADYIDEKIPNKFVSGPNDGKKTKGGYQWDMHIDANGLEGWYDQLYDFSRKWIMKEYDKHETLGDKVYIIEKTENEFDPSKDYIFGSMDVLKEISFKNFIADCEKVRGDETVIIDYENEITKRFKADLDTEYAKIIKTPKNVRKLKEKTKVVMSQGAIDDLDNMEE